MRKECPSEPYTQTSSGISVLAECTPGYVRDLALAGLVPHIRASNGIYLYPASAAELVRKLKAQGLARRGIYPGRGASQAAAS
jgi:hypothetical protein